MIRAADTKSSKRRLDRRLLSAAKPARHLLIVSMALQIALGAAVIVQALLLSRAIARVFHGGADLAAVSDLLIALALVIGVRALLTFGGAWLAAQVSIRARESLRRRFIEHVRALGPAFTRAERSGDLALTAAEGIEKLDAYYREYLPGVFVAVVIPLLILAAVLPLDALTFVILLITAPLIPLFMALIGMAAGALARHQFMEMRHLGAHFLDVMQGLTTLKLFNRSAAQAETIARITGQFRDATLRVLRVAFLSAFTLEMLATLSVAIVAVEIAIRLMGGGMIFEQALFLLVIAPEFYLPLRALGARFHIATESKAAAERIFAVLDTPLPPRPAAISPPPAHLDIRFEHVTFAYAEGARPALTGVSFTLAPGERVALVGASGGGKTTIVNLLLRFITAQDGTITVDGADLTTIDPDAWRAQIGWVAQSPYLFNLSAADNIRMGRPDASDSDVVAAARAAGAHDFIARLPEGYATRCGERGLRLSGGQAHRIALARAFLRNAPLLILDEPTSQLDPESERQIGAALEALTRGRTTLVIAHRLNTVIAADRILVLDQGRLVAQGTHNQLLESSAHYRQLAELYGVGQ